MNRLILVGNGFDLAHNLKTSYADFIKWYFEDLIERVHSCQSDRYDEYPLCQFSIKCSSDPIYGMNAKFTDFTRDQIKEYIEHTLSCVRSYDRTDLIKVELCPLIRKIAQSFETRKWVDIENEYYSLLKERHRGNSTIYSSIDKLNKEMAFLTQKLAEYLCNVTTGIVEEDIIVDAIKCYMLEPFSIDDISIGGKQALCDHINSRLILLKKELSPIIDSADIELPTKTVDIEKYNAIEENLDEYFKGREKYEQLPIELRSPDKIMLLNFNYTNTADLYLPQKDGYEVNHIHGTLSDVEKMIFGYGDELDDDLKNIIKRNDNDYLTNIKSIRYLETDNYRKLLSFIDSSPFQIYIMGHSCGNSDRTMLNTLFEHKNCVSIKPFYYDKGDGKDNYIELIENILRNFTDAKTMRDKVVNKSYCKPLPNHS